MKKIIIKTIYSIAFILVTSAVNAQTATLTIIGNKNGVPSAITSSELKSIFKGEKQRWSNGTKISIALLKTSTSGGKSICKKVYNLSSDEVNKYWLALVFQGKAEAPLFFNSASDLEAYVAQNPGTIGIIDRSTESADLKIVSLNGQKSF